MRRGIALRDGRTRVLVQDEVEADRGLTLRWAMHTRAEVRLAESATAVATGPSCRSAAPCWRPACWPRAGASFAVEAVQIPLPAAPLAGYPASWRSRSRT